MCNDTKTIEEPVEEIDDDSLKQSADYLLEEKSDLWESLADK